MPEVIIIKDSSVGLRIDKWIKNELTKIPQGLIEKDLRNGKIKVNKKKVKSSYKLIKDDKIYLYNIYYKKSSISKKTYIPKKSTVQETEKDIVEDNDNFIVINKKAGLPVQGGTNINENVTNIFSNSIYFKDHKPYIVHRIDKDTSGILIIAKNRETAQQLTSLFRIRKIHKTYLALSEGKKKILERAITHYETLDKNNKYTFFKLKPITGRKHQIRKHMTDLGYPIIGDNKYFLKKKAKNKYLMLHAYEIKFILNNKKYSFKASIPKYFMDFLIKNNLKQRNF